MQTRGKAGVNESKKGLIGKILDKSTGNQKGLRTNLRKKGEVDKRIVLELHTRNSYRDDLTHNPGYDCY